MFVHNSKIFLFETNIFSRKVSLIIYDSLLGNKYGYHKDVANELLCDGHIDKCKLVCHIAIIVWHEGNYSREPSIISS